MRDHFITAAIPRPFFDFSRVARARAGTADIKQLLYLASNRIVSDSALKLLGNAIFARVGVGRRLPSTNLFVCDLASRRACCLTQVSITNPSHHQGTI
jgi:hypothetical protein